MLHVLRAGSLSVLHVLTALHVLLTVLHVLHVPRVLCTAARGLHVLAALHVLRADCAARAGCAVRAARAACCAARTARVLAPVLHVLRACWLRSLSVRCTCWLCWLNAT